MAGDCVSDPSVDQEEGGQHKGISRDHHWAPTQKQHCGIDWLLQENITSCPIRSKISTGCWLLRTESAVLTSAAAQCSQQQSTVHRVIYGGLASTKAQNELETWRLYVPTFIFVRNLEPFEWPSFLYSETISQKPKFNIKEPEWLFQFLICFSFCLKYGT